MQQTQSVPLSPIRRRAINWNVITRLILIVALCLPVASIQATPSLPALVQPELLALIAKEPTALVNVIVQKTTTGRTIEDLTVRLGGQITKDLHIIRAFATQLPAKVVPTLAQAGGVRWVSLDGPMQSTASSAHFTTWSTKTGTAVANGFTNVANMLGTTGKNNTYGYGSRVKGAFAGFQPEYTPGLAINKLSVGLQLYTPKLLGSTEVLKVTPYVAGQATQSFTVAASTINTFLGTANAGVLNIEVTTARAWKWADLNSLQVVIDQSGLSSKSSIYYDAIGIRIFAAAGTDTTSPLVMASADDTTAVNTGVLTNVFQQATRAVNIWNEAPYWQGSGVTVAVVDSGSFRTNGIGSRLIGEVNFNSAEHTSNDQYGHGSFVTGLIADDGATSSGKYMGIAPKVNILGLRVSDDAGMAYESDVVAALQWIYTNKTTYNIRVVNLSLNAAVWQSYHTSPLDAASEVLWFNGVVVVASAGNHGTATLYPPANDPFVITVGATDDVNTVTLNDDVVTTFSAYGVDEAGQVKPDLVAPGRNIIAYLPDTNQLSISTQHPENRLDSNYFRMSGTSMSAPMVSGAAAILLQASPNLTPDQVKYRLKVTANSNWPGYNSTKAGAGYLDVYAAVKGNSPQSANTGLQASQLLWSGSEPITWGSASWNSVSWNTVSWNTVSWNTVSWNTVSWNSDYWEGATAANITSGDVMTDTTSPSPENSQTTDTGESSNNQQALKVFLPLVNR